MGVAYIVGLGKSGKSALDFLRRRGWKVVGYDDRLAPGPIPSFTEGDLVVVSPGVPPSHPFIGAANVAGVEVVGEAELAFRELTGPAIGITGTNGKTTAVLLITHVLQQAGIPARALGNVGEPLTSHVESLGGEVAVIELSSFQLMTLSTPALDCAVILNITSDHLDYHGSFENYVEAKLRIGSLLREGAPLFTSEILLKNRIESILPVDYKENLAAWAVCHHFGVTLEQFKRGVESFEFPPHRRELVREVGGVAYINDSKATNPCATSFAVEGLGKGIHLLAGGLAKGVSFEEWRSIFPGRVVRLYLFGEAAEQIERELGDVVAIERVSDLRAGLLSASRRATSGESVVLSPGCASFDMFSSYEQRGERFREFVEDVVCGQETQF